MEDVKTVKTVKVKKDTRSNFQKVGFYMSILYIALTGLFLMQMFKLNVLPDKYSIIVVRIYNLKFETIVVIVIYSLYFFY